MDQGSAPFGRFGYPSERPETWVPMTPEMEKIMLATNAHIEAERAKAEAAMNTLQGRKKAAEAKLAEKKRKESNWLSRVIYDRGDGWKPIWGTAKDEELRIYTIVDSGEHRFWGIKPIGMGIDDFWEKYDPEVKRYEDRQQETPVNPDAPVGNLIGEPSRSLLPYKKAVVKPRKQQKPSEINSTHRVRKSTESQKVNKNTRRSLVDKVDAGQPGLGGLVREVAVTATAHASGRTTRKSTAGTSSSAQQEKATKEGVSAPSKLPRGRPAAKAGVAAKDDTSSHPKRPRGRPAAKGRPIETPPKQKKTPAAKGNARVTKSSQTERRPSAPSTHRMRTRREGPAELLQLP